MFKLHLFLFTVLMFFLFTMMLYAKDTIVAEPKKQQLNSQGLPKKTVNFLIGSADAEITANNFKLTKERVFYVKVIKLIGCESFTADTFNFLIGPYENRKVTIGDLEDLSHQIQREYWQRELIAAVFVPKQKIVKDAVFLQVVEGRMGELIFSEEKYAAIANLRTYWRIREGEIIRFSEIQKSLQLMKIQAQYIIQADLCKGKKTGTIDVILNIEKSLTPHSGSDFNLMNERNQIAKLK